MKKLLALVLSFLILTAAFPLGGLGLTASAATYGSLTYTVSEDGYATITDCDINVSGVMNIPSEIDGYPVIGIGDYAFASCNLLTDVVIPEGITTIGNYAFQECSLLKNINIPNGVVSIGICAFTHCISLTEIAIPEGVTTIGECAFYQCKQLKYVSLPTTLTYLYNGTFSSCIALESIVIPSGVTGLDTYVFNGCSGLKNIVFSEGITTFGMYSLRNCSSLLSVNIPSTVTTIGNNAFDGCTSLKRVDITDVAAWCNINFVTENANPLYFAHNLYVNGELAETVDVPEGVKTIPTYAFEGCTSMKNINLPYSLTSIGSLAFSDCSSLEEIIIPTKVTSIGATVFRRCYSLKNVVIPNSVTVIKRNTFWSCTSLKYIKLPTTITDIEPYAFYDCSSLKSITIPKGISIIKVYAFQNCTNMNCVYIPNTVTRVQASAFDGCNINTVFYGGTGTKWKSIVFEDGNTSVTGATIYYNCSMITRNIDSVSLSQLPDKLTYTQYKDELDLTGGSLLVDYRDGQEATVDMTTLTATGFDNTVLGEQTVTVTYSGYTVDFKVAVVEGDPEYDIYAPGDLNADGEFKANDLVIARETLTGEKEDESLKEATDCTGDYVTDARDLVRLKKHIANNIGESQFTYEIVDGKAVITGWVSKPTGAVTFPETIGGYPVVKIDDSAFSECSDITSILLPPTVTEIGDSAFELCSGLKSFALPDSITKIGSNAFAKCIKMLTARLSDNILIIPDNLFNGCTLLSKMEIPENVNQIGESAFYLCTSLIEINIPEEVTVLNENTFYGCRNLIFVGMPENLKEIKAYTFYGCERLNSVDIPVTVVMVGDSAFADCSSLLSIVIPYEAAFGSNVFDGCEVLVVKGLYGSEGMDAAVNSGVTFEPLDCGHTEFIVLNAVSPTCESVGYSGDKYCVKCGKIEEIGVEVPKTGHITQLVNKREVTCTSNGYTGDIKCSACNKYLDYGHIIYSTGHYAESMPGYIAPTCTKNGYYGVFNCEKCGKDINNEYIPALGHDTYLINDVHEDCVNEGYTGDWKCFECGEIISAGEIIPVGDHYYDLTNHSYASCLSDGYTGDYICTGCGDVKSTGTVIPKKEHTPVTSNYKAATCTQNGYSGDSTCFNCGTVLEQGQVLPLLGHRSVLINYVAPTCTTDGYSGDQVCSVCKVFVTTGSVLEKTGHNPVLVGRVESTPTVDGYTGDLICDKCNELIEKGKIIPANHQHTFTVSGEKDATCSEEGYTGDSVCDECGYKQKGESIPVIPHDCTSTTVDPTCTDEGYTLDECKNCDYENKHDIVDALDHNYAGEWIVTENPTCINDGSMYRKCSRCDSTVTESIPSLGHTEGERYNVKAPTCTEEGYTGDYLCTVCGETIYGEILPLIDHSYGEWIIRCYHNGSSLPDADFGGESSVGSDYLEEYRVCSSCSKEETRDVDSSVEIFYEYSYTAPTCTEDGVRIFKCHYCEKTYSVVEVALGHNYITEVIYPTCTEDGYTKHTCDNCGDSYNTDTVPATGHTEVTENQKDATCTEEGYTGDKVCSVCKEVLEKGEVIPALGHTYGEETYTCHHSAEGGSITGIGSVTGGGTGNGIIGDYRKLSKTCSDCGFVYSTITDSADSMFTTSTTLGDCVTKGHKDYDCKYCDYVYTENLGYGGHNYSYTTVEATCTKDGSMTRTCSICNTSTTAVIPATGHTETTVNQKDATCTEEGYTGDTVCSVCNETLASGETIPTVDHSYSGPFYYCYHASGPSAPDLGGGLDGEFEDFENFEEYVVQHLECSVCGYTVDNNIPCEYNINSYPELGYDEYTCVYCDYSYTVDTGVVEPEPCTHSYSEEITDPTCTEQGYTTYTCSLCGYSYTDNYTDPNGHSWDYFTGNCYECGEICYHDNAIANGDMMCDICGFEQCHNCMTWDHNNADCPHVGMEFNCGCGCPHCDINMPECGCCEMCMNSGGAGGTEPCPNCGMEGCMGECTV